MEKSAALVAIEAIEAVGELPVVPAQGTQAEVLASEISLSYDLTFVMNCCQRLVSMLDMPESDADKVLIQALWSAAHIAYARCFNRGLRTKLQLSDVKRLDLPWAVQYHKEVLALSDSAHSSFR